MADIGNNTQNGQGATPVANGLYKSQTNGITNYHVLPNYNVSSQFTPVSDPQEVKDYITHLNSLGTYTPGSSSGVQFDAQSVARQAQSALDQYSTQPNSRYAMDSGGNFTTQQNINDQTQHQQAVQAGTEKAVPVGSGVGYVPTGSASDQLIARPPIPNQNTSNNAPTGQLTSPTPSSANTTAPGQMTSQATSVTPANLPARPPVGLQTPGQGVSPELSSIYSSRPDLQSLYNSNGSAKNPNDPRVSGIPTLADWYNKYGINETPSAQIPSQSINPNNGNLPAGQSGSPWTAPATSGGSTNTAGTTNPTSTGSTNLPDYNTLVSEVRQESQPSQSELDIQKQIDDLTTSANMGINQTTAEPIPYQEKQGIAANIQNQSTQQIETLTQKLARVQAQRQAALDATKATLAAVSPIALPLGSSLTYPTTGQQIGGISSSDQSLLSSAIAAGHLQPTVITRSPAEIQAIINTLKLNPNFDFTSQTASAQGQIAAATAQSQLKFDANGNPINYQPTVPGATNNTTVPIGGTPTTTGATPNFTLSSDGKTVLANGTPVDLPTFKQMTGQQNVADSQVNFSAVKGGVAQQQTANRVLNSTSSSSGTLNGSENQYFLSGDISPTGLKSSNSITALNNKVQAFAQSLGISNWSASKVKALNAQDAANYGQAVQYLTNTGRSVANAENGFKQVLSAYPALNNAQSPLWNKTANEIAQNLTGGQRNSFLAGLTEIGNEYSQVFSRGGANTVSSHVSAADVVNGNLSMNDLKGVLSELQAQGKIVVSGARDTVNAIMGGYGPKTDAGTSLQGGSSVQGGATQNISQYTSQY